MKAETETVSTAIRPHPELSRFIPELPPEKFGALKADIEERGVIVPLILDAENYIIDGHHRYRAICELRLTEFPWEIRRDLSLDKAEDLAEALNIRRRHLTVEQMAPFIVRRRAKGQSEREIAAALGVDRAAVHRMLKECSGAEYSAPEHETTQEPEAPVELPVTTGRDGRRYPAQAGTLKPRKADAVAMQAAGRTVREIAAALGVSVGTVHNWLKPKAASIRGDGKKANEQVAAALPDLADEDLPTAAVVQAEQIAKAAKEAQHKAERDAAAAAARAELPATDERWTLHTGHIALAGQGIADESIDLVVTDPPYDEESLPLYEELGYLAARVLKPGGSLLVMCGQSYLPAVFGHILPSLPYHWTLAYETPGGQSPQLWTRKVNTFWKPVLWFIKGVYDGAWVGDVLRSAVNDNDKEHHHWGQSESGMHDLLRRFAQPGMHVLDPFCGGGSTLVVALRLGCFVAGIDVSPAAITTSAARLTACASGLEAGQ